MIKLKYVCTWEGAGKENISLTELIKVCVHSIWPRNGAHKSCFEECCPFVSKTSQTANIILQANTNI